MISDLLLWIVDTDPFIARAHCGEGWSGNEEMQAYAIASAYAIIASYIVLPLCYFLAWKRWHLFQERPVNLAIHLLAAFFFFASCAATHYTGDVLMFEYPAYRLDTLVKSVCAVCSLAACGLAILDLLIGGTRAK